MVVAGDEPVDVFEEKFVAETFSGARKLDHETALSSHKTSGVLNVVATDAEGSSQPIVEWQNFGPNVDSTAKMQWRWGLWRSGYSGGWDTRPIAHDGIEFVPAPDR